MFSNIGDQILEMITGWLQDGIDVFVSFMENIIINYDGLAGTALSAYNVFVIVSGVLLVSVCLARVISMLLSEADGSEEASAWSIIVDTVRAGIALLLTPLIISVAMNLIRILSGYFFNDIGNSLTENVQNLLEAENLPEAFTSGIGTLLIWLLVLIVVAFFVIKMFVSQAQILMNEILSPLVAVSISSENFDFMETWSRDLLSHTATIIVLTLSMALFVEVLTGDSAGSIWTILPGLIGTGALVVSGPTLIKNIWYSSGAGKTGQSALQMLIRRRR